MAVRMARSRDRAPAGAAAGLAAPVPPSQLSLRPHGSPPAPASLPPSAGRLRALPGVASTAPSPTSHHRSLPAAAAPSPSSTLSLRPRQVPPPPPAVIPAGFTPRVVAPISALPRPLLASVVVGGPCSLPSLSRLASEVEGVPVSLLDPEVEGNPGSGSASLDDDLGAPASSPSRPRHADAEALVLASLSVAPPRLKSMVVGAIFGDQAIVEGSDGEGWEMVGPRRRPRHVAPQPQRPRRPPDLASSECESAFRRKLRGLCYRCFSPRHFVKHCRDPIRCLTCRRSGHRAKDCKDHLAISIDRGIPRPRAPPAALRPGNASTWAAVASGQAPQPHVGHHPARDPKQVAPRTVLESALSSSTAPPPPPEHACGAMLPQPQLVRPCVCLHANEMRAILSDPAASLRAELKELVADAVSTILATSTALRDWIEHVHGIPEWTSTLSPSLCGDVRCGDEVPVDETAHLLAEMKASGGSQPCHEILTPCASPSGGSELGGFDASLVGVLRLSINSGAEAGMYPLDADVEVAALDPPLATNAGDASDDDVALLAPSVIALRGVAALFSPLAVPVLPTPPLPKPRALVDPPAPDRRSSRLATKPILPAVDKAMCVLHKKMGLDVGDMPLVQATKVFANSLKTPLSGSAIDGVSTLLRLKLPSMTASDVALIALAGPGGSEFLTGEARDDSV